MRRPGTAAGAARAVLRAVASALVVTIASTFVVMTTVGPAAAGRVEPFRGLGVWVDVFDYSPARAAGGVPTVTPEAVDDMAALGVRTLYLQVARVDDGTPGELRDTDLMHRFLARADAANLRVVAWYLPEFADVRGELADLEAIHRFERDGRRFDGLGLDVEWTRSVPDHAERNERVVTLARKLRARVGRAASIAAIVYPAVQLEVVNPALWPGFPYRRLAPHVDVWMPMAYFTFRSEDSGFRDALRYTTESVERLRTNLRDPQAPVHLIGGIADVMHPADFAALREAARGTGALGLSVYDYSTTASSAWPFLRGDAIPLPGTSTP